MSGPLQSQLHAALHDQHHVISPYCLNAAMLGLTLGLTPEAHAELNTLQGFHLSPADAETVLARITAGESNRTVHTALAVFLASDRQVEHDFAARFGKVGELRLLNFADHSEHARRAINDWVYQHTAEMIPDLLDASTVTSGTSLVLVAAVALKAKWATTFDAANTIEKGVWRGTPDSRSTVPLMRRTGKYKLTEDDDWSMLELPYANDDLAMHVFLPHDHVVAIPPVNTQRTLRLALTTTRPRVVKVTLPRFRQEFSVDMLGTFKKAGANALLAPGAADGIAPGLGCISNIIHRVVVDVDEEGTTAAAATAVVASRGMAPPKPAFTADRPFYYEIRRTSTDAALFTGLLVDP